MIHTVNYRNKLYSDLGAYLHRVSSDPALYASYFWWRQHYEVDNIGMGRHFVKVDRKKEKNFSFHVSPQIFCEACRYLHENNGPSVVEDLRKEWVEGGKCIQPPVIAYIEEEEVVTEEEQTMDTTEEVTNLVL